METKYTRGKIIVYEAKIEFKQQRLYAQEVQVTYIVAIRCSKTKTQLFKTIQQQSS
jgi:hypothetical protein